MWSEFFSSYNRLIVFLLLPVQGYEYEYQYREGPQGGASVAQERQRDPDHRHKSDRHPDIDEQVHEYARRDTIPIYPGKGFPALLGVNHDPPNHEHIKEYYHKASEEAPFLSNSTEDEVGALFRDETESGLCAVKESLAGEATGPDRDHALVDIIADSGRILLHAEKDLYSFTLMILEYVVEYEFGREYQGYTGDQA